jgi:hypothetical protein
MSVRFEKSGSGRKANNMIHIFEYEPGMDKIHRLYPSPKIQEIIADQIHRTEPAGVSRACGRNEERIDIDTDDSFHVLRPQMLEPIPPRAANHRNRSRGQFADSATENLSQELGLSDRRHPHVGFILS